MLQVTTTLPSEEQARELARSLVEQRLAACGQVLGPIHSVYWWQGTLTEDTEWLLILKTTPERGATIESAIREQHPYEVPEILATPATASEAYEEWVRHETV